jgi:hypothetical protein
MTCISVNIKSPTDDTAPDTTPDTTDIITEISQKNILIYLAVIILIFALIIRLR